MKTFVTVLLGLAMLGVLGVLFAGLLGVVRGNSDPHKSNKLMQYRVILQGIALALFGILLWINHG